MHNIAILSFYSGVVERGVETFAFEIALRLSKKHQVTVFQGGNPKPFQKFKTTQIKANAKIPNAKRGVLGKFYLDYQSLKVLVFSARAIPLFLKGKYDFVICLNGGWQTAIFKIASKLTSTKVIIPGEAGIGSDDAWNILFHPDCFVALTMSQYDWAKKLSPEVNVTLIPNGVDLSKFNPKVRPRKINLPRPIVICTSALDPHKRVDQTIKAVAQAKLSLLLLGDGQARGAIDSLGKRLLGKNYLRLKVPYSEIPAYYRAANVFTLASETEAFGIAYIEAMACNLPVVTTSDDSRAEIIGRAGILTDVSDIKQYAKDLVIATKSNYRNIPYDQSLKFSWNKVAQKYSNLLANFQK
ncbi:MAG: glycosyltransferase family 4 protein [Candidatus Curtissbacteria bacterium]|nr:glycosyltransferase family 4 protein [Candidatus Curtissbacteria bacterium]